MQCLYIYLCACVRVFVCFVSFLCVCPSVHPSIAAREQSVVYAFLCGLHLSFLFGLCLLYVWFCT